MIFEHKHYPHCPMCGQALNWKEKDKEVKDTDWSKIE